MDNQPDTNDEGGKQANFQADDDGDHRDVDKRPNVEGAISAASTALGTIAEVAERAAGDLKSVVKGSGRQVRVAEPQAAPIPSFPEELNNIDFRKLISGPLQAAVDAQVLSSLATIDFINKVGFTAADGSGKRELVMVDFTHTRSEKDKDGNPVERVVDLKVPLLSMLPVPSLRIEHVIIDFNAKLNSAERTQVSDELGVKAELAVGWGPVSFKVSGSYQRRTSTDVEIKREYTMNVNVKAVQDEMPAGLERLLGILAA